MSYKRLTNAEDVVMSYWAWEAKNYFSLKLNYEAHNSTTLREFERRFGYYTLMEPD